MGLEGAPGAWCHGIPTLPKEQLIIIGGTVLAEMTDHPSTRLGPGGFAMMGAACRISSPAKAGPRV
jgi:hypothetical protein